MLLLSSAASATVVDVWLEPGNYSIGDTVYLHLYVDPSEPVGGQFSLSYEVEPRKYVQKVVFFYRPSPSQCVGCAGQYPLSEEKNSTYVYEIMDPGNYRAVANFGGVQDEVHFSVFEETTTTSTTSSTTTTSTTTTSTSSSTSTTSLTPLSTTSSTLAEGGQQLHLIAVAVLAVLFLLALVLAVFFYKLLRSR